MKTDFTYTNSRYHEALLKYSSINAFDKDRPLSIGCFERAIIAPGPVGGVYRDGEILTESMSYSICCQHDRVPKIEHCDYIDEDVLFLGSYETCWGHCITDNLKHLWPFLQDDLMTRLNGLKWYYAVESASKELPSNFIEMLSLLGVDLRKAIRIQTPTQFRKVFLPEPCFYFDISRNARFYTEQFGEIINRLRSRFFSSNAKVDLAKKVYFSRAGWKRGNPDFGERHIERAFAQKGFRIVRPENLSFAETVKILGDCGTFASTEGSTAHNSLFLPLGAKLIVVRKADYVNRYQPAINQLRDLDVTYIDANGTTLLESKSCPFSGPFFLYCNRCLADYLGVKPHFPMSDWLGYVLCWVRMKLKSYCRRIGRVMRKIGGGICKA